MNENRKFSGFCFRTFLCCYRISIWVNMKLNEIIDFNKTYTSFDLKDEAHPSLSKVDGIFYVEPQFNIINNMEKSRFALFSAPGASGKSTLAKYIAYKTNNFYWNLAKIKLGENSLSGTLWDALDGNKIYDFFDALKSGDALFMLDAFDEAEIVSGRAGIEFLLNELNKYTLDGQVLSLLFFTRTESARYIADYFNKHNIPYCHYEISFFDLESAKKFIQQKRESFGKSTTLPIKECIEKQFSQIEILLNHDKKMIESFLGYAPVLEALTKALDEDNNTMKLLEKLKKDTNMTTNIISNILCDLMKRETKKLNDALTQDLKNKYPYFDYRGDLYTEEEQCVRVIECILANGQFEENSFIELKDLPTEIQLEYNKKLETLLRDHPFIQKRLSKACDFTGPAFRDYVMAKIFYNDLYSDLAHSYCAAFSHQINFPSQMFFDFYLQFSENVIDGKLFPYVYESFKAKESSESTAYINICSEKPINEIDTAVFQLCSEGRDAVSWEATLINDDPLHVQRLSNTSLQIDKEVVIGVKTGESKLFNTFIDAKKITLQAEEIIIEAKEPGSTMLYSEESVDYRSGIIPNFRILAEDKNTVGINFPNIKDYYALRPYQVTDIVANAEEEYREFNFFTKRIMRCMRKHRKDFPAKDREYIDYRIVANNDFRKKCMGFMLKKGIIFTDSQDPHLYKLNTEILSQYGINWAEVVVMDNNNFMKLYEDFVAYYK